MENNGNGNRVSWHWLAVTMTLIVLALIGILWQNQSNAITMTDNRVSSLEDTYGKLNVNIVRICTKLNIPECK